MFYILAIFLVIAVGMQVVSTRKNDEVYHKTNAVIRSQHDLLSVKETINLSMKLAIIYIVLFILFIVVLIVSVVSGTPLSHAVLSLFIFGVITLSVGLFGKQYEKRIKSMEVQSDDPEIRRKFQQYLVQWSEPRFQLPD